MLNNMFFTLNNSPWPMMMTLNSMTMFMNLIMLMNNKMNPTLMLMNTMLTLKIMHMWNKNSTKEFMLSGFNNKMIKTSTKMTMMNLILSEMMFFMTFFYINYSNLMFNNINQNMKYFNKMYKLNTMMAFLNLIILLTSSMTMMMFINMNKKLMMKSNKMMTKTMLLSIYFLMIQNIEYKNMNFNPNNSIMMSNFFTLTMFHMIHVILGTMCMMLFLTMKMKMMNMKTKFMATCWYWHFIDMIWMMIFLILY